jgi:membrane protein YqaA with SNARE-associated domain
MSALAIVLGAIAGGVLGSMTGWLIAEAIKSILRKWTLRKWRL